ncbi:FAD-binding domain-containing protein [Hypoxylon cercidicola]|nr:FAD-binding domain-containing protein [Hypoxylon cercidicola]
MRSLLVSTLFTVFASVKGANFAYENELLTSADIGNFSAIAFGNVSTAAPLEGCRVSPGTAEWPLEQEWSQLNSSLGGALIKAVPPAAVCYDGPARDEAACNILLFNATFNNYYINNPVNVFSEWPEGDTCHLRPASGESCIQGGFPTYVVNATTVKQIQMAVNFARNKNLRLVIKNTGHDLIGRSAGAGSLSIWTHWLKDFEFVPEYSVGEYKGMAARVGTGIESWEMFGHMSDHNMTAVVAGGYTVGAYGGWIQGGGHSALASKYGLGADQALSIQVVTADGSFVTADPTQNTDLFFALRGGGGSTFGIVTSLVVKAHPATTVLSATIAYSVGGGFNVSVPGDIEKFWTGFDLYHEFGNKVVDNQGTACMSIFTYPSHYSYVSRLTNTTFSFTTDIELPDVSEEFLDEFVRPLVDDLEAVGLNVTYDPPSPAGNWGPGAAGRGDTPGSTRFGSRLFPRENFVDPELFAATQLALRRSIEEGYTFHGIHMVPTEEVAGYPGNNAANPAFRKTTMHADLFDFTQQRGLTPMAFTQAHDKLAAAMDRWRAVSPGAGAYFNEADLEEPDWQQAFFGTNYPRLLSIKQERDPWGLFYAPVTVGSEEWTVVTEDGLPTQNGRLCRVGAEGQAKRRAGAAA